MIAPQNRFADLHIHTHYSDGSLSCAEVIQGAVQAGLSCISITDHDTIEGVGPARREAEQFSLEVVPGIELSSEWEGKDIHILGYFLDCQSDILKSALDKIQDARIHRIQEMIQKLKSQGIDNISLEEVCALSQSKSVGRPHLASVLHKKGWVSSLRAAFDKYLGEDCPAYTPKYKQSPYQAIDLIRRSGGVAVLAHPVVTNKDELIAGFVEAGLKGLEVYYPNVPATTISYYENIARKYNLIMTGGSDAHGAVKDNTFIGKVKVPYRIVEQLRQLAHSP